MVDNNRGLGLGPMPPSGANFTGTLPTANLPTVIRLAAADCSAHAISTGTAEVVLKTFSFTAASLPTIAANSIIVVHTLWTYTNSANTKNMKIRLGASGAGTGGTSLMGFAATTTATYARDLIIFVRATNSQIAQVAGANTHEGSSAAAPSTAAIDLTANWDLILTGQPWANGETVQLESAAIEIQIP